jgi:hypothetical protein
MSANPGATLATLSTCRIPEGIIHCHPSRSRISSPPRGRSDLLFPTGIDPADWREGLRSAVRPEKETAEGPTEYRSNDEQETVQEGPLGPSVERSDRPKDQVPHQANMSHGEMTGKPVETGKEKLYQSLGL